MIMINMSSNKSIFWVIPSRSIAIFKRASWLCAVLSFLAVNVVNALPKGVDAQINVENSLINISFAPNLNQIQVDEPFLIRWITTRAKAVAKYYHRFPVSQLDIIINPSNGSRINGTTHAGLQPIVLISIGDKVSKNTLQNDWVLVHEMVHLAFPSVSKSHHWMEEGLATYIEPIVRVQAGLMTEQQAWYWILTGVPKGQPKAGDRGLDHTPTWGRTYWGGALYCLVVDYKIRKKTNNRYNLGDALRAITKAGGTMQNEQMWSFSDALKIGDKAIGQTVLMSTYLEMKDKPISIDLISLWKRLGVSLVDNKIVFNQAAPESHLRHALFQSSKS